MNRERSDLDIPEGTVWPATEQGAAEPGGTADPEVAIELGPGDGAEAPPSLDEDRDDAERNAASGGWDGANEQIENDFEVEQLRRGQREDGGPSEGETPLT